MGSSSGRATEKISIGQVSVVLRATCGYHDGMKPTIIHVNRQHIAMNARDGGNRPVYTIKREGKTLYAREVVIHGPSRLVYNGTQLTCGARAWLETHAEIDLIDEMTFREARTNHGTKIDQ